jgi:hypothetical protein
VQNAGELNPHHKFLVHNKTTLTTDGKLMICNYNATTSTPLAYMMRTPTFLDVAQY